MGVDPGHNVLPKRGRGVTVERRDSDQSNFLRLLQIREKRMKMEREDVHPVRYHPAIIYRIVHRRKEAEGEAVRRRNRDNTGELVELGIPVMTLYHPSCALIFLQNYRSKEAVCRLGCNIFLKTKSCASEVTLC